uniref:oocyte zinc finger protein XlCOF8.4-like n=1 Tax=Doryrhamphus excisus TaxID=161450 RepID=UPI0025AEC85A|nr:oocyte zinc finger protein XlCOF8.4-like [Doryrhamphus excisus]
MFKVRMMRTLLEQRLNSAVEEIFGLFERTIAEYEEALSRTKVENERQRQLLGNRVFKPHARLRKADIQQMLLESQEEVSSEQQEWSSSVGQEELEPPHIKEEEEELWEQYQGLEQADMTKSPINREDDEDKAQTSQFHHCQREKSSGTEPLTQHVTTEDDERAQCPDRNFAPLSDIDDMMSHSSESDHNDDTKEPLETNTDFQDDLRHHIDYKHFDCSECGRTFNQKCNLTLHMRTHTGERPFACTFCNKRFSLKHHVKRHMRIHTGEKPFPCAICGKRFREKYDMKVHMRTHVGKRHFTSSSSAQLN